MKLTANYLLTALSDHETLLLSGELPTTKEYLYTPQQDTDTMNTYAIEYTDTFAGETNYSWVKRATIQARDDRAAIRAAKAAMGLTGLRCKRDEYNGAIILHPSRCCTVLFITQTA